jgi:hypothetical protein
VGSDNLLIKESDRHTLGCAANEYTDEHAPKRLIKSDVIEDFTWLGQMPDEEPL